MCEEEIYRREDQIHYMMVAPTTGLTVDIINNLRDTVVFTGVALTRSGVDAPGELKPLYTTTPGFWKQGRWDYEGAVLPGQGFSVTWRKRIERKAATAEKFSEGAVA